MYVYALRIIAKRCIAVSFYLGKQKSLAVIEGDTLSENDKYKLIAELAEIKATSLYYKFQRKTLYGYPMQCMPHCKIRQLAMNGALYFEQALRWHAKNSTITTSTGGNNSQSTLPQYHFMIGKVSSLDFILAYPFI